MVWTAKRRVKVYFLLGAAGSGWEFAGNIAFFPRILPADGCDKFWVAKMGEMGSLIVSLLAGAMKKLLERIMPTATSRLAAVSAAYRNRRVVCMPN